MSPYTHADFIREERWKAAQRAPRIGPVTAATAGRRWCARTGTATASRSSPTNGRRAGTTIRLSGRPPTWAMGLLRSTWAWGNGHRCHLRKPHDAPPSRRRPPASRDSRSPSRDRVAEASSPRCTARATVSPPARTSATPSPRKAERASERPRARPWGVRERPPQPPRRCRS
jgi:hypothetical protein